MEGSKNKQSKLWCCKYHIFGVTFIAFGISLVLFLPDFVNKQIMQNLELRPDSRSFSDWKKPSVPLFFDIYIFNWTNPNDINNNSTKPILKQLGPYRFREQPDKYNITFNGSTSVRYRKLSHYYFDTEGSVGSLDDIVNTVDMVAIGVAKTAENFSGFKLIGTNAVLGSHSIHVTKKVREILFEGYYDSLLTVGKLFDSSRANFDTVGFFIKRNGSDELGGSYEVHTGVGDMSKFDQVLKFNDLTEFPFNHGECRKLKGSAGEFFPPETPTDRPLYLFTPDMCRSFPYDYEKDVNLHEIHGNRFAAGLRAIDNGTYYAENQCYSQGMPSGVMNISVCNFDQPMFISYPHFYLSDPTFLSAIEGLSPNKEKHQSYITLEPKTGITLEVTARFQTNVYLRPYGSVFLYKKVPKVMMPLFYVETMFIMDEEKASQLRFGLSMLSSSKYFGLLLVLVGLFIIFFRKIRYYCCCKNKNYNLTENPQKAPKEMHRLM